MMEVESVIPIQKLAIAGVHAGGRTGIYNRIIIIAALSQFHLTCSLIKAHHKTIYEEKIVCIKDKIDREGPFPLDASNPLLAGFIS